METACCHAESRQQQPEQQEKREYRPEPGDPTQHDMGNGTHKKELPEFLPPGPAFKTEILL
jgi:hypothetical protein